MYVIHRLVRIFSIVEDGTITIGQTGIRGDLASDDEEMPHEGLVLLGKGVERGYGLARHDEQVSRGLRVYIPQYGASVVFIDDIAL